MKKKDGGELDARISGICFLLYAVLLFLLAFVTFYTYWVSTQVMHDSFNDYIGWVSLFSIFGVILMIAFLAMSAGIFFFTCIFLLLGIFLLLRKPVIGIAITSLILSACYVVVWITFSKPNYGLYGVNPVLIAGTVFFGIMALILSFSGFASARWFVGKYWFLPWILLVASVLVSPLEFLFIRLMGDTYYSMEIYRYLISVSRLILLFPAYFFGCLWMKKKAETVCEEPSQQEDETALTK